MRLPIFSALLALAASTFAGNWPAWRGPAADGTTPETDLPLHFSATEGVKWKVPLPERGNSTPIVWGRQIFLTQNVGTRRTVMCLDRKDGHTLWQAGPEWKGEDITHGTNPYCSSSPATDGERVVAWFGSAGLWCWSLDGKEQWHVDLGPQKHIWGYGASPVLHGDLCILNFGPGERSFIVAVDKRTGKEVWRFNVPAPEVKEGSGGEKGFIGSWNTGIVSEFAKVESFLISLPGALFCLDLNTGKECWHCNGLNALAYAEPIITGNMKPIYASPKITVELPLYAAFGGYGGFALGVQPEGGGNITDKARLWQERKNPQRIGSNVERDGVAWLVGEPGIIQCIVLATGKDLWKERMQTPAGRANTWSSLVRSGDRIYAVTQNSDVVVFKASTEKYEQLAVNSLGDGLTNSSLAVSDGQLFLRTHKHLWCIGK
ncbi:MAG: PQQ-binding-like beta-propeller repeat protein [Chthoniobacteraceae bacterium]